MDGAGDGFPWVFGLAGGHAHHFGSGKGEDDGQKGGENGGDSGGEEPVFGEIDQAGSVADAGTAPSPSGSNATCVKGEDPHNRRQTDQDEDHDGDHFDAGEPELRLAMNPYGQDVQAEDQTDEERAPQGRRALGEPVPHDDPGGGELGGQGHDPIQPVEDRHGEGGPRADEFLRVQVEGPGVGHGHGQLAQAEHDAVNQDGSHSIGEHGPERSRFFDGVAGAEEKPGPDDPTDGDHGQVPDGHVPLQGVRLY